MVEYADDAEAHRCLGQFTFKLLFVLGFPSMPKLFTVMYVTERNFPQQALELPFTVFTLVLKSLRVQTSRSFLISNVQKSLLVFSNVSTGSLLLVPNHCYYYSSL